MRSKLKKSNFEKNIKIIFIIFEEFINLFSRIKGFFLKNEVNYSSFFINKRNLIQSTENVTQGIKVFFTNNSKLTFTNCDRIIIQKLKEEILYNKNESFGLSMSSFLFKYNIRVLEIENYIDKYRRKYNEKLLNCKDPIEATKYLKIVPFISNHREVRIISPHYRPELIDIFNFQDKVKIDKVNLVELFGGNEQFRYNISFYFARGTNSIHKVPFDDYYRKRFESLENSGLAISGNKISEIDLLKTLSIKEIRSILKPHNLNCNSKVQGIKHIMEIPQYFKSIESYFLDVNCYFKLLALPFEIPSNLIELVNADLNYYDNITNAIISISDVEN